MIEIQMHDEVLLEGNAMQIYCKLSYFTSSHPRYRQLMYPSVLARICPLALSTGPAVTWLGTFSSQSVITLILPDTSSIKSC